MSAQKATSKVTTKGTRSLVIVVAPASRSTGQFEVRLNQRRLCVSRTPFFEAARVLRAEGVDPSTILVMRHSGSRTVSLKASIAVAAGLTVEETKYGPRVRRWKPLSALDGSHRIAPTVPGGQGAMQRIPSRSVVSKPRGEWGTPGPKTAATNFSLAWHPLPGVTKSKS
jgi:hypothetical protein